MTVDAAARADQHELDRLDRLFAAQKAAFARNVNPGYEERQRTLERLRDAVVAHQDRLVTALDRDYEGRSADETRVAELIPVIGAIRHALRHLKGWMKPGRRWPPLLLQPSSARIVYQPLGVVGIVTPWNYPIILSLAPLVCVLAAGNRALIKMPAATPRTALALEAVLADVAPEDQLAVITSGPGVAEAFPRRPFDHIIFTGSTAVGRSVMRAAADHLTPVTLELGGKSPAIVGRSFPIRKAARQLTYGKCLNAGQTCVAPDHIFCPRERRDAFVDAVRQSFTRMFPTINDNPDYSNIISGRHLRRLRDCLRDAEDKGARVIGVNPANESFEGSRKLPLHIVLDVSDDMKIMQEEIFGPLMPIKVYDSLDEVIADVNGRPRPLALYYFERDRRNVARILAETIAGGVCINDTMTHVAVHDLPFGGVGDSGMGQYHGYEGFLTFSKQKSVFARPRFHTGEFVYPPYGRFVRSLAARVIR